MLDTTAILERILRSPLGQQAIREMEADQTKRRQSLADELVAIEKERQRKLPPLAKGVEAAAAKVLAAREALRATEDAYRDAEGAYRSADLTLDHRAFLCERELRASASPEVGETIARLRAHYDETHNEIEGLRVSLGWLKGVGTITNAASVRAHNLAVLGAIRLLDTLRLEPSPEVVSAKIKAILAEIPAVEPVTHPDDLRAKAVDGGASADDDQDVAPPLKVIA